MHDDAVFMGKLRDEIDEIAREDAKATDIVDAFQDGQMFMEDYAPFNMNEICSDM